MNNYRLLTALSILGLALLWSCTTPPPTASNDLLATIVAQTQTALAVQPAAPVLGSPTPLSIPTPLSTPTPLLQDAVYKGVTFSYDPRDFGSVSVEELEVVEWLPEQMAMVYGKPNPWGGTWHGLRFNLVDAQPRFADQPQSYLRIYPLMSVAGQPHPGLQAAPALAEKLASLAERIAQPPTPLTFFADGSGGAFETQAQPLRFQNGSGFRAVVFLPEGYGPYEITNAGLYYIFEGLTDDGRSYAGARIHLSAASLPDIPALGAEDIERFGQDLAAFEAYKIQAAAGLTPEGFRPSLAALDALLASLKVEAALAVPSPEPCLEAASLESETSSGGLIYAPGEQFSITWRLTNRGTCTWTPEYALVYVEGHDIGTVKQASLGYSVQPGESVDLSVALTAPSEPGDYASAWMLRRPDGSLFGTGENLNAPLLVEIRVEENNADLKQGEPAFSDTFDSNRSLWYLAADENIGLTIEGGALKLAALQPAGDQWRLMEREVPSNIYLEAVVQTGPVCSGKDSYGLIVRAPHSEDFAYDSGYVFGVSCDGQFRLYRMDDGTYQGLLNWAFSPAILAGPGQTNTLGVLLQGSSLKIYANGKLLAEFTDSTHASGRFGALVRAAETPGFEVALDEIAYWPAP